ncbi:MAG TPA: PP2C family protein-serine/threonine phosphatase [Gemmata sp.]|nr:PP2C family protein-serine/threonine phosphatase [Gemmata sp.]
MTQQTGATPLRSLQCMEIWGGNRAVERAVATPGLEIWVFSRPHERAEAGGDVYYASLCGGGRITRFILADVAGHGATVAEVANSLRDLMRKNINRKDQVRLVQALNRQFAALADANRFATAVVATYLTRGDTLTVCNAGHPRPFWRRADAGEWSVLDGEPQPAGGGVADLPLGVVDDTAYTRRQITLGRGDLLLFYTDAWTEAANPAGELLGESGLLELVGRLDASDPASLPAALSAGVDAFRGGRPADDDATLILLRHTAGASRRPGLVETLAVYAKLLGLKRV